MESEVVREKRPVRYLSLRELFTVNAEIHRLSTELKGVAESGRNEVLRPLVDKIGSTISWSLACSKAENPYRDTQIGFFSGTIIGGVVTNEVFGGIWGLVGVVAGAAAGLVYGKWRERSIIRKNAAQVIEI